MGSPCRPGWPFGEAYVISLLRVSWEIDRVFVDFQELVRDPEATLTALADELASRGIPRLDVRAGAQSVQPSLRREWFDASTDGHLLSSAQVELWTQPVWRPRVGARRHDFLRAALSVLREFEADEAGRQEARASIRSLTAKVTALQTSEAESNAAAQQRATEGEGTIRQAAQ